ncbi:ABC transporter ATP-binding protein [Verrucomicrobium spinosum]|uniref:ABC transporter ATP-binding protein n=1 Tax=Verrucomicrobium spinosum TaxID=2736 RepID=UPI00017443B4|nr:ABC transporter ATP-binding protein [Verrucomicrobium spinosum]
MAENAPSASTPSVYEARGLKKEFDGGKVAALRGVDLDVREGEFVAVTGPSGCGKSTLLQMLGSLALPSDGTLKFRGRSIPEMPDPAHYRSHDIGFVFQAFHLLPTFTVLENVQIPMFEGGLTRAQRKARAVELLESVGLGHRLTHFPSELSGGERQRVAIARGLANGPSVVLADEPTGNLDSANADQILELLLKLHRDRKVTLVLVTHDLGIAGLASRTIRMKDGRVVSEAVSSTSSLANHP